MLDEKKPRPLMTFLEENKRRLARWPKWKQDVDIYGRETDWGPGPASEEGADMIRPGHVMNLETLKRACYNGDLALVSCKLRATGAEVIVVCAMERNADGTISPKPLAKLFDDNPYEELLDPTQEEAG